MEYLTSAQIAKEWSVSQRWVSILCKQGRIPGAVLMGHTWVIPKNTIKPADFRRSPEKCTQKLR